MDRNKIIYAVIALAVLVGVVYLFKYSGSKKKTEDAETKILPTENDEKASESKQGSDGMGRSDEQEETKEEREDKRPTPLSEEEEEDIQDEEEDMYTLSVGDKGEQVKELQRRLQSYDIDVKVTGVYDSQTAKALSHLGLNGDVSIFDVPYLEDEELQ